MDFLKSSTLEVDCSLTVVVTAVNWKRIRKEFSIFSVSV